MIEDLPAYVRQWFADAGRAGAAAREHVEITCAVCGQHSVGLKTRKFCSGACRQAAKRRRVRGGVDPSQHVTAHALPESAVRAAASDRASGPCGD